MAKDPAFLFYSEKFITGVLTMTFEDRGKYITLLALMHQQGRMNEETIRFIVGSISDSLRSKFRIDEQGNWYNEKLEEEANKRQKFAESRRENGKKGGRKPNALPNDKPYALPTENLPININIDKNINENIKGVQGENVFSDELTPLEIGQAKEYVHITARRSLTDVQIVEYWKAYSIHSAGEYYHTRARQLQHFRNWLKLQPNEKSKRIFSDTWKSDGSPDAAYDPL